jgi:hypothetical protein
MMSLSDQTRPYLVRSRISSPKCPIIHPPLTLQTNTIQQLLTLVGEGLPHWTELTSSLPYIVLPNTNGTDVHMADLPHSSGDIVEIRLNGVTLEGSGSNSPIQGMRLILELDCSVLSLMPYT